MKVIIAGSRTIRGLCVVLQAVVESGFEIKEVVCGMANGVDEVGRQWAIANNIPVKEFRADWDNIKAPGAVIRRRRDGTLYNAKAGIDRNAKMAEYADALILVWDGKSRGSADMLKQATKQGLKIYEKVVEITRSTPHLYSR